MYVCTVMYAGMYLRMYVRMYICMYVCTQTHMWCIFSLPINMGKQTSSTNRNVLTA